MNTSIIYRKEEEEKVALWEGYQIASVKASAKMNSLPPPNLHLWGGWFFLLLSADLNSSYVFKKGEATVSA
jgi:hypothetical protein